MTLSSPLFLTPKRSFALNAKGMALAGDKGVWIWDGQFAHSYISQHEIQTCSSESHPAATFNHKAARRCLVTRRTRRLGNRCLPKLRIPSKCWLFSSAFACGDASNEVVTPNKCQHFLYEHRNPGVLSWKWRCGRGADADQTCHTCDIHLCVGEPENS